MHMLHVPASLGTCICTRVVNIRRLTIGSLFLTHVRTALLTPLQVKALAICSRFQFIHVWKPLLLLAVDRLYSLSTGLGEYSESQPP